MKLYIKLLSVLLLSLTTFGYSQNIFRAIEVRDRRAISQWLKNKPDFSVVNDQGQTLLIAAVQAGNKSLVHRLLKKNVDVNVLDGHGKSALDYAVELDYEPIARQLIYHKGVVTNIKNQEYCKNITLSNNPWKIFVSGLLGVLGISIAVVVGGVFVFIGLISASKGIFELWVLKGFFLGVVGGGALTYNAVVMDKTDYNSGYLVNKIN